MSKASLLILGALVSVAVVGSGQTIVDPAGGGHYRDLQTAIDAVPAGTVIKVIGGSYGPLRITKSLTIVGAPVPMIASPITGSGIQPPAIRLVGSGSESLALDNVRIIGFAAGGTWSAPGAGIEGSGFQSLRIHRSVVSGHIYTSPRGDVPGAPAVRLPGATTSLVLSDSSFSASPAVVDDPTNSFGFDGAPAIDAESATVFVLGSIVAGGNARLSSWNGGPPAPLPCPCPGTGKGGAGIIARELFESGSSVVGGSGGAVSYYYVTPSNPRYPWGKQADGAPYVAPVKVHIPSTFDALPAVLGGSWDLRIFVGRDSALFLGDLAPSPAKALGSWFFLDPAAIYLVTFVPSSATRITFPIPNDTALAGAALAAQFAEATTLSRPVFTVIGF